MQFTSPTSILLPLCNLLDTWGYEDDQGTVYVFLFYKDLC